MEKDKRWNRILDFVVKYYKEDKFNTKKAFKTFRQISDYGDYYRQGEIRLYRRVAAVAAGVLLIIGVSLLWNRGQADELTSFTTTDSIKTLALADGTEVTLAPHSKVTYNLTDYQSNRKIKLEGKAFFVVKHIPNNPFIVNTSRGNIEDLGTSFQVNTTLKESTSVLVTDGKVRFFIEDIHHGVTLTKGMRGVASQGEDMPVVSEGEINETAWATGIFKFNDTPIKQALNIISECYHVDLSASDTTKSVSGTIKADNVGQVVNILETTLGIRIYKKSLEK